jgi:hypothetical protein
MYFDNLIMEIRDLLDFLPQISISEIEGYNSKEMGRIDGGIYYWYGDDIQLETDCRNDSKEIYREIELFAYFFDNSICDTTNVEENLVEPWKRENIEEEEEIIIEGEKGPYDIPFDFD